uniref:MYND-type domain-containing protein n=1 Tax=Araucaria cunninghamii TaxID=56994 RepID=A0A0D6R3W0_ARACU
MVMIAEGDTHFHMAMDFEKEEHNEKKKNVEESFSSLHLPGEDDEHQEEEEDENQKGVEEEDDEDDEEEEEEAVTLGFVQKAEDPSSLARHFFPSKAGGTPAWLDPTNIPSGKDSCCGICGDPLQHLIQVYAPIEGNPNAFHRTIYVFMCPKMECLRQDQLEQRKASVEKPSRSVKVFRCQLPRTNSFYSVDPPKHDGHDVPLSTGAALCSWCGTWRGGKICSGCKLARYCSRQHQVNHWRRGHATDCQQIQSSSNSVAAINVLQFDCLGKAENTCLWPELEVIDEEENDIESGDFDEQVPQSAIVAKQEKNAEFLRELNDWEVSKDQRHWASFEARIAKAPDQVLRYCRSKSAKILWPRIEGQPQNADIPKCTLCNGPRYFELQVLSQLLYFFKVQNDSESLDWSTIAIYTCAASCGENSLGYVEEFAWVQLAS